MVVEKGKEKVTIMKVKADLGCEKCYKKVKKALCKIPQIRDQSFDEKANIVTIKVVCCSPEKVMDKLCKKGDGAIKTIEIVEPPKPPQPQPQAQPPPQNHKAADKPKAPEKAKEPEKPKQPEKPKEPEKPKQPAAAPAAAPAPAPAPAAAPAPAQKQPGPPQQAVPQGQQARYMGPYYDGYGGPAFSGYGMPPPPPQQPYECYGRPVYDSWGGGCPPPPPPAYRQSHVNGCDYFSDENPQSCSIM